MRPFATQPGQAPNQNRSEASAPLESARKDPIIHAQKRNVDLEMTMTMKARELL
jgi:hypothetical protein